ncbi:MAG: hypothetical protein HY707_06785 [Ignavibacteriae bacterium]|nr:hypothetical protein [Ignavibacteriota bacterium]
MKRIWLFGILVVVLYGCGQKQKNEVVVIEKTKTYHTEKCPRVNMAHTVQMHIEEAQSRGCKPCPACNPDSNQ